MMRAFFKYYLFWILFFVVQKPIFMLYNLSQLGELVWQDWFLVPFHAFPLDLSVASYITAVFGLLLVGYTLYSSRVWNLIANVYTGFIIAIALLVFICDTGIFPYWGFHLDKTVLMFLASPQEVMANAVWWVWMIVILIWLVSSSLLWLLYRYWMQGWMKPSMPGRWPRRIGKACGMLLMTGLLFLPIRGSVTTSTMNTGRVYFSDKQILNIAAINPIFNFIESLSGCTFDIQRYTYMSSAEAQEQVATLLPATRADITSVLTTQRPNIIFFILESFSSNAWDAMPCLRALAEEGLFFKNAYASSFRTDRGVVATLSGFPGQPTSSLMTQPAKSQHLPQLSKNLSAEGYQLKFWYGGDEDFTNMRSYLIDGGYMERVNDHSFSVSQRLSKWGVPDHLLFAKASQEIMTRSAETPTLDVILSLSSHEPFEVPATRRFENLYLNSIAYTDSCIGAFVDSLRGRDTWSKILLVFVADHGYPYPTDVQNHEPRRYYIPIIWAGGALKNHGEISSLCSQVDVVPTLLAQMGIDYTAYTFGKNVLDTASVPFAFYSFNDGFGLLTEQDSIVIDAKSNRRIMGKNAEVEQEARAFMQCVMETIDQWQ